MASKAEVERLLSRAASDKAFRSKLIARPQDAADELGLKLTTSQISSIKGAKAAITVGGKASDMKLKQAAAKLLAIWI